jgi:predicted naringenin-chalcone synthase
MFLTGFRFAAPGLVYPQHLLLAKLADLYSDSGLEDGKISKEDWLKRLTRFGCKSPVVQQRSATFFPFLNREMQSLEIEDRQSLYQQVVLECLPKVIDEFSVPDEIFHVTCTGYLSPSIAQILISKNLAWSKSVVTHLYHMGCYAAIPALRMARGSLSLGTSKVIKILHSELCTLHFGYSLEPQNWVIQSLFADGVVAYEAHSQRPMSASLEVLETLEETVPDSLDKMSWVVGTGHFHMTLSRDVPAAIGETIRDFVQRLIARTNLTRDVSQNPRTLFAIHPGGPRILEQVASALGILPDQWRHSRDVFRDFGNMSSATLPMVWSNIMQDHNVREDDIVVSLAFGPGLTIAGAVSRLHR